VRGSGAFGGSDAALAGRGRPGAQHGGSQGGQAYAAIDLGTNNCRLLIARPSGDNFIVVDAFSRVVRLGEGLAQTGRLSEAAMDRALAALHVCADKLRRRSVHLARSVATEACRRAENGADFIERVRQETGIALDIISAQEEARLAVLGCHILLEQGQGPAMIFDIGGGSTELMWLEEADGKHEIVDWILLADGVVTVSERFGGVDVDAAKYEEMRAFLKPMIAAFADRVRSATSGSGLPAHLLGTSGTVTTIAGVQLGLRRYDRARVDGCWLAQEDIAKVCAELLAMSYAERMDNPCIGRDRADLVLAGCAILEEICAAFPAPRVRVADRGLREGILTLMMKTDGTYGARP